MAKLYSKVPETHTPIANKTYAVDPYIIHDRLEEFMNARAEEGFKLIAMYQCEPHNGENHVTLIWEKVDKKQACTFVYKGKTEKKDAGS